jgi:hypothetical protein
MKIGDKTLGEIFQEIPLSQKIVVVVGSAFIVFTICYVTYLLAIFEPPKPGPSIARIAKGKNTSGILDPSLSGDAKNRALAYTVVMPEGNGNYSTEIRLSMGMNNCFEWNEIGSIIESRPDTLIGPDYKTPVTRGIWRAETPSIVYDPADTGREWKLFAYRYFWAGNSSLARLYGVIVMRSTDKVSAQEWSREEWLLSASPDSPPPPYGNNVQIHLNKLHPDLADVYFYARPSVVMVNDVMVMSLSAFVQGKNTVDRVVMIASSDHGRTWRYLGTPLRDTDLKAMGSFTRLGGASLFMKDGVLYFSAILGNAGTDASGAYIMDFEDASTARLRRYPKTGAIAIAAHVPTVKNPPTTLGGGALTYHPSCKNKVLMSESVDGKRYDVYVISQPDIP